MARTSNKRERLVASAKRLIHRQGYARTTLADIAREARVPLGNVYYYFKTKDALAQAVLTERAETFDTQVEGWDSLGDPRQRLLTMLDEIPNPDREAIARYGCALGSLCQELDKSRSTLALQADGIMRRQLQWVAEQFRQLGKDDAEELALQFMAMLQGIHLITNVLNDSAVVDSQLARLRHWVASL